MELPMTVADRTDAPASTWNPQFEEISDRLVELCNELSVLGAAARFLSIIRGTLDAPPLKTSNEVVKALQDVRRIRECIEAELTGQARCLLERLAGRVAHLSSVVIAAEALLTPDQMRRFLLKEPNLPVEFLGQVATFYATNAEVSDETCAKQAVVSEAYVLQQRRIAHNAVPEPTVA